MGSTGTGKPLTEGSPADPAVSPPRGAATHSRRLPGRASRSAGRPARRRLIPSRRAAIVLVLVLVLTGLAAGLMVVATRPSGPRRPGAHLPGTDVPRYPSVTLSVTPGPGLSLPRRAPCALEAASEGQREHGLMGVRSLHGYAGMAFVYSRPAVDRFWMKSTLVPLSIAWFDGGGSYITSSVMLPCPTSASTCPTYGAGRPFSLAIEVPAGELASLGIGPGSTVQLGGACAP